MSIFTRHGLFVIISVLIFSQTVFAKINPLFPVASDPAKLELATSSAFDGTNYLVPVMNDVFDIDVQFISQSGTLGSKINIVTGSADGISNARIAYGGGKYLLVWTEGLWTTNTSLKGIFIAPDGTKGTPFTIVSGIPSSWGTVPDVAFGGGKFLVAYEKPLTVNTETYLAIYGKFVSLNQSIGTAFRISSQWGGFNFQQIAFDGTNFLVIYRDDKDDYRTLARFVNPVSGPHGNELIIESTVKPSDNPGSVLFDGEKYLVVWTDQTRDFPNIWQFYGRFVQTDGTMTTPFTITAAKSGKMAPMIAFDGTKYLISWTEGRNCGWWTDETLHCSRTGYDIYGRYYSKTGLPLTGEFPLFSLTGNEMGGFSGKAVNGKVLGTLNKGFQLSPGAGIISEDVSGSFLINPLYEIFAPNKQEKLNAGSIHTIRWKAPADALSFQIQYSTDNKQTWHPVSTAGNVRTYNWTMPQQTGNKTGYIRIFAKDSMNTVLSTLISQPFVIRTAKISQPNGGELLTAGQSYTIKWSTFGLTSQVANTVIQYSTDGTTWNSIKQLSGNPGQAAWTVPDLKSPLCRIRAILKDLSGNELAVAESESVFTVN